VLAVGTELGESDLWGPPLRLGGRLIRIDVDPGQLQKNTAADVAVAGDARAALAGLLDLLPAAAAAAAALVPALRAALQRPRPTVIEVPA
jgi:acetolactate synthase I/II/III large subunit